jgi:hypothetical protein
MSEVRKWLNTIGLAQYADAFETNDLDFELLGQVDDQLLKDIGVASAGHRLRKQPYDGGSTVAHGAAQMNPR